MEGAIKQGGNIARHGYDRELGDEGDEETPYEQAGAASHPFSEHKIGCGAESHHDQHRGQEDSFRIGGDVYDEPDVLRADNLQRNHEKPDDHAQRLQDG